MSKGEAGDGIRMRRRAARRRIYLDYASTTPLDSRVLDAMRPYFSDKFGNASSIHAEGAAAAAALRRGRETVARTLQARADEIVFTSGGTESNNLAIFCAARAREPEGFLLSKMHFVTTVIEHSSVLECFRELERRGAKVSYAPVKKNGIVDPSVIGELVRPNTVLVSVGLANNEIGVIQPVREIAKLLGNLTPRRRNAKSRPLFHTDASQAALFLDLNAARLGVDLMTLDGHKMYGPKGAGALYVRRGAPLSPVLFGGGQERGLRSTTENIPGAVGFAEALRLASESRRSESVRLAALRDYFFAELSKRVKMPVIINGDLKERLPNNINISIPGLDAEFAVLKLDAAGIACSAKSSCLGSEGYSYVVRALGGGRIRAASALRFTLGCATAKSDIDRLLSAFRNVTM